MLRASCNGHTEAFGSRRPDSRRPQVGVAGHGLHDPCRGVGRHARHVLEQLCATALVDQVLIGGTWTRRTDLRSLLTDGGRPAGAAGARGIPRVVPPPDPFAWMQA